MTKILLTSFTTWQPHQKSNASDDLLGLIYPVSNLDLVLLRCLPVDISLATKRVIQAIENFQPQALVCCGMAENRTNLAIEVQAFPASPASSGLDKTPLTTIVDLAQITKGLVTTTLSYDAGKFVCEGLYYGVLNYLYLADLGQGTPPLPCIFVHVPPLRPENQLEITAEFTLILKNLANSGKINRDQQKTLYLFN